MWCVLFYLATKCQMLRILRILVFIFIIINYWFLPVDTLKVNFRENYAANVDYSNKPHVKREMSHFFDKASYTFNGFERIESVPVAFPIDICIMNLEDNKYAVALHRSKAGLLQFAAFKMQQNNTYELLMDVPTPLAVSIDCKAMGDKGYVALAYNITTAIDYAKDGSPIYEISGNRIRAVQYFATPNLVAVYLRVNGNNLFMLQAFAHTQTTPHLNCPYFQWFDTTFNKLGSIPCTNARHLQPFEIDYESYVAVANYADQDGRTATYSEIYKYARAERKFELFQKIRTNAAVDVKYFSVPYDEVRTQHFLVFGNSKSDELLAHTNDGQNLQANSVFYLYEKGQFVPYQRLSLYAVKQFLPVQSTDSEKFLLLIACTNQDIKIYNFNDWKFEESEAQFTDGALGRGVANMRIYQENDARYLVIANVNMADNETNIFRPIFKQDMHANALRQQIIDWAKTNIARLQQIDVEPLKKAVEHKMATLEERQSAAALHINELKNAKIATITTKSLNYPSKRLNAKIWQALTYANRALDLLEARLLLSKQKLHKREINVKDEMRRAIYEFDSLNVRTLNISKSLKTQRINGVDANAPVFARIHAEEVQVADNFKAPLDVATENDTVDTMNVENLQITGRLNEYTLAQLLNDTLKRKGSAQQFLKTNATIRNLQADSVVVTNQQIAGHELSKLVPTAGGNYVINQYIQFSAPVNARNVVINERLNDIHVHKHKFDVLLKRANVTQVIDGLKRFEHLKVLQPITIAGHMSGKHLAALAPNKALHADIVLNGDYTITGDVSVNRLLRASDIITANHTLRGVLQHGVRMDHVLEDVFINFQQAIHANNSIVSHINAQHVQHLVRTNTAAVQIIEAEKHFTNGLVIRQGLSAVKTLNGHNIEQLQQRLLLKHTNQTLQQPMHFGKIVASAINTPADTELVLNAHNLSAYLTKSTQQHLKTALKVDKLIAQHLSVHNLNTNGPIFNATLTKIYQQRAKSAPPLALFNDGRKFHGTIYARNLKLNNATTFNGKPLASVVAQLADLNDDIKYIGNYIFNYDMNITNLTFYGTLNGIRAADFGHCWLQKTGAQNFTAPQTFATINAPAGVTLTGRLNGFSIDDYYTQTYWLNRDEHIAAAIFLNPIQMKGALYADTVNGISIPQDVLYRTAAQPQVLFGQMLVQHDLQLANDKQILNTTKFNGIDLATLERFLNGYAPDATLHVENAHFATAPLYNTLNHYDMRQTLDAVWLANENVNLQQHVELANAHFEGLLELEGPINNVKLQYLKENYLSRSKAQVVYTPLIFTAEATFDDLRTNALQLNGALIESKSNTAFNFDEFVANTLKTSGPHKISATWSMLEAIVQGDLQRVQVNKLNLMHDVLHRNATFSEVTATKRIKTAVIRKLYATPTSTVNKVNVDTWIRDAVYVYENHTIQGVTTLDTVNVYNDLRVDGRVNDVIFDAHNLLLRDGDQIVHGNVCLRNALPQLQRILTVNFENLQTTAVNGKNVAPYLENPAHVSSELHVHGHLIFKQPIKVSQYRSADDVVENNDLLRQKWKRLANTLENSLHLGNTALKLQSAASACPHLILDHFEVRQTLPIKATRLIPLTLLIAENYVDIIAVLDHADNDTLKFYRWEAASQEFVSETALAWLPQHKSTIELIKLLFEPNAAYLNIVQRFEIAFKQNLISNLTANWQELLQWRYNNANQFVSFTLEDERCLAVYDIKINNNTQIHCLQSRKDKHGTTFYLKLTLPTANLKQLLSLTNNTLALLFNERVEIWHISNGTLQRQQDISLIAPKQIAFAKHNGAYYLAALTTLKTCSLQHGTIEIYSAKHALYYKQMQTLDCIAAKKLAFSKITQSHDLLLHILTGTEHRPLVVLQHKGVMGFQEIVGATTLPAAQGMQVFALHAFGAQHMIALFSGNNVTFVETVLKRI